MFPRRLGIGRRGVVASWAVRVGTKGRMEQGASWEGDKTYGQAQLDGRNNVLH